MKFYWRYVLQFVWCMDFLTDCFSESNLQKLEYVRIVCPCPVKYERNTERAAHGVYLDADRSLAAPYYF